MKREELFNTTGGAVHAKSDVQEFWERAFFAALSGVASHATQWGDMQVDRAGKVADFAVRLRFGIVVES